MLVKLIKLIASIHKNVYHGPKRLQLAKKAFGFALKRSHVLANVRFDTFDCECVRFVAKVKMLPAIRHFLIAWICVGIVVFGLDRAVDQLLSYATSNPTIWRGSLVTIVIT